MECVQEFSVPRPKPYKLTDLTITPLADVLPSIHLLHWEER